VGADEAVAGGVEVAAEVAEEGAGVGAACGDVLGLCGGNGIARSSRNWSSRNWSSRNWSSRNWSSRNWSSSIWVNPECTQSVAGADEAGAPGGAGGAGVAEEGVGVGAACSSELGLCGGNGIARSSRNWSSRNWSSRNWSSRNWSRFNPECTQRAVGGEEAVGGSAEGDAGRLVLGCEGWAALPGYEEGVVRGAQFVPCSSELGLCSGGHYLHPCK